MGTRTSGTLIKSSPLWLENLTRGPMHNVHHRGASGTSMLRFRDLRRRASNKVSYSLCGHESSAVSLSLLWLVWTRQASSGLRLPTPIESTPVGESASKPPCSTRTQSRAFQLFVQQAESKHIERNRHRLRRDQLRDEAEACPKTATTQIST